MQTRMTCLAVLWVLLVAGPVVAVETATPAQNVVLVSWDGVSRDVLQELLATNRLPAMAALIREGSLREIEVRGHRTSTMPGHATMLTGYLSDKHRINNNEFVKPIPEGLTIFERLETVLGTDAIRTIMVAGKSRNLGGESTNEVYSLARKHMDYFQSTDQPAAGVVRDALPVLARLTKPRFLLFLHFPDPDMAAHADGKDSGAYRAAIVRCDQALARVVEALQTNGLYAATAVYVTSDHGFDDQSRQHKNAPHIYLVTNDRAVIRGGYLADIPATILTRLGVDIATIEPSLAGQSLTVAPRVPAIPVVPAPPAAPSGAAAGK